MEKLLNGDMKDPRVKEGVPQEASQSPNLPDESQKALVDIRPSIGTGRFGNGVRATEEDRWPGGSSPIFGTESPRKAF